MSESPAEKHKEPPANAKRTGWLIFALLLTFAFLIPAFMLMRPAAKPGARAAHAARHGFIQMDNEEGALLFQAMQIRRGESIYHPLDSYPYVAGTYTPLFMAAVAAVDDLRNPSFSRGRNIVWGAALGIGVLLVLLTATSTRNAPVGILAGLLFLATYEVYRWVGFFRVDFPAIFLSLAGLAVVVLGRAKIVALAVGSLLMVLALYTKQTTIAAPAACMAALLLHQPRKALALGGWMLGWGLPLLVALEVFTGGQFLRHTVLYNMNEWHQFNLRVWSRHVWNMHRWFFIAGLLALPWLMFQVGRSYWAKNNSQPDSPADGSIAPLPSGLLGFWQPLALYGMFAQWNFMAIGKAGSAENYLLEPIAGWALLVCLTAGVLLRKTALAPVVWQRAGGAGLAMALLMFLITHAKVVTQPIAEQMRFNPYLNPARPDFEAAQILTSRMKEAKNPYSELAIYHLRVGAAPVIQPFIMSELARQGRWNQDIFVADIRAGEFDVVIALDDLTRSAPTDVYTKEMLAAFHGAYKVDQILQTPLWKYHILVPRGPDDVVETNEIALSKK